jgi:hypothetical protein
MSSISSNPQASTTSAPARPEAGKQFRFEPPKPSLIRRINLRMVLIAGLVLFVVGAPFSIWLRQFVTGGIIKHSDYYEVNLKAMSSFDLDQVNGQPSDIPAKFRALEGKRVLLVGEMWDPHGAGDDSLSYFQLVYSKTKCCFNGPPLAQHFVDSFVNKGKTAYYYGWGMVDVWGTLHVKFRRDPGGVIKSVYAVDVDEVDPL